MENKARIRFKFIYTEDMAKLPIGVLDLGTRADNAFKRQGIITINDFIEHWDDFGAIKNIGAKTVKQMKAAFLSWYMEEIEARPLTWKKFVESIGVVKEEAAT